MRRGVQARGPGAHLGAFIFKSIESNEEMNDFRDEVSNEGWELQILPGSIKSRSGALNYAWELQM